MGLAVSPMSLDRHSPGKGSERGGPTEGPHSDRRFPDGKGLLLPRSGPPGPLRFARLALSGPPWQTPHVVEPNGASGFRVADLDLVPTETRTIESFETVEGGFGRARLATWLCTNHAGLELELAYITPEAGSREVRCIDRRASPGIFDAIVERVRLTIGTAGPTTDWVMLKLVRPKEGGVRPRFNLFGADWQLLRAAAGVDVRGTLLGLGARDYTPPERERAPAAPSVAFPTGDRPVPLAAFVCTRVMPVLRG